MSTEKVNLEVVRFRDAEGQPTCAVNFDAGLVCQFYRTQRFGTHETCVFAEQTGPRGLAQSMERREGGTGTLIPLAECPVWINVPELEVTR